jgi:hypothetical protein
MCENVVKSRVMPLHKAKKAFSKEEKGEGMLLNYPISCNFAVNEKNIPNPHQPAGVGSD